MVPRVKLRSLARSTLKRQSSAAPKMRMIDPTQGGRGTRKKWGSFSTATSICSVPHTLDTYRFILYADLPAFQPFARQRWRARRRLWNFADRTHDALGRPTVLFILISNDTFSVLSFHIVGHPSRFFRFFFFFFYFLSFPAARYTSSNVRCQLNTRRVGLMPFLRNVSDANFDRTDNESVQW